MSYSEQISAMADFLQDRADLVLLGEEIKDTPNSEIEVSVNGISYTFRPDNIGYESILEEIVRATELVEDDIANLEPSDFNIESDEL